MMVYTLPANLPLEPVVRDGRDHFIVVFLSRIITHELRNFRCLNCGWVVFQYSNKEVDAFVYGSEIPEEKNAVDVMCSRCHLIYRVV